MLIWRIFARIALESIREARYLNTGLIWFPRSPLQSYELVHETVTVTYGKKNV